MDNLLAKPTVFFFLLAGAKEPRKAGIAAFYQAFSRCSLNNLSLCSQKNLVSQNILVGGARWSADISGEIKVLSRPTTTLDSTG